MPGRDRTGPMGRGAMTGRAAGYCAGSGVSESAKPVPGRGFGKGFGKGCRAWGRRLGGGGCGWRKMFHATGLSGWVRFSRYNAPHGYPQPSRKSDREMEMQVLRNHAEGLQLELDFIRKRLAEAETGTVADRHAPALNTPWLRRLNDRCAVRG